MNNAEKQFVDILSAGIRGKVADKIYENVEWDEVIDLANKHKVEGIIYLALRKSNLVSKVGEKRINLLKQKAAITGIGQSRHISGLSIVFNKIIEENIPVIVLKGLVVRDFYPQPDQRTMSDADILVHKDDVEKVKKLLIEMGYIFLEDHKASHHIALVHHKYPVIEVHWNLFKRDGFSNDLEHYERLIWNRAIKVNVGEAEVLSISYEDLALHLCMHMAAHLASTGFGVRQLCDLVLLVEKKGEEIDWNSFIMKARMYGFEKFSLIMFLLCKELFQMEIPKELEVKSVNNKKYVSALIDEIFESGVHGKKEMANQFATQVAFNFEDKDSNATLGAIKRYFRFIFPRIDDMSDKYSYAKKFKILAPIAWIHHLFVGIFASEYTFKDKFEFLTKGAATAVNRNKLLD
ncbi:MAG: nucleotidyltransferase family protein [Clostridium sp.]|nr:nucleotidyltransferase family protein [Clostridium sp.]